MGNPTLLWLRNDLRLADHPALWAAIERQGPVVPVFIWSPEEESPWQPGAASRWWLHHSLLRLSADLEALGSRLIIRRGPAENALHSLLCESGADSVFWSRRYEPALIARDAQIKQSLVRKGITAVSFNAALLYEPWEIATKQRAPYQVFTPFWRACLAKGQLPPPLPTPERLPVCEPTIDSEPIQSLELLPRIDWAQGMNEAWQPGEQGALVQLRHFVDHALDRYAEHRNRPDLKGVSRLSPYLHFGEIGPRQVCRAVQERFTATKRAKSRQVHEQNADSGIEELNDGAKSFLAEIGWREFAHHLLFHFPETPLSPLRERFQNFPWQNSPQALRAWQRGQTGFPIVDAGMRQLWKTGWMHNRVRMIVASFLVKDLLIDWLSGARWFWDTLVDADLASNTLGWQWTAGCGADAAPYFRIFNPTSQGEKFDPAGDYVRRWVPELATLPTEWLHCPAEAPPMVLSDAGITIGRTYPRPIVDHAAARQRALASLAELA
jgi:deoxyribodipyrimidine photo-lyase